jgi:hypothetical protein
MLEKEYQKVLKSEEDEYRKRQRVEEADYRAKQKAEEQAYRLQLQAEDEEEFRHEASKLGGIGISRPAPLLAPGPAAAIPAKLSQNSTSVAGSSVSKKVRIECAVGQKQLASLGLVLAEFESRLLVLEVQPGGMVAAWNAAHPGLRVEKCDRVLAVNRTPVQSLIQACRWRELGETFRSPDPGTCVELWLEAVGILDETPDEREVGFRTRQMWYY